MNAQEAAREIAAGRAHGHALWTVLKTPEQRDGYALRPVAWEGAGEYQRVHHSDGRDVYVRVAGASFTVGECEGPPPTEPNAWERRAYRRALDLLQQLVQDAVTQAGPGPDDRDLNRPLLNSICREAETLLYEARGRA